MKMKSYRIFENTDSKQDSKGEFARGRVVEMDTSSLTPADVMIRVEYSGVNYKDALAGLGKGKILKKYPLNGGIDCAGLVVKSQHPDFKEGDSVLCNGSTLSEWMDGGFGEFVNIPSEYLIPLPKGLDLKESMILGTAGFTAALCVWRFLKNDQTPEKGPALVTGATGGVGIFAIQILSKLGFEVIALTGKKEKESWLKELGAKSVLTVDELGLGDRPLESAKFGCCIDNLGGEVLSKILPHISLWGNVASVGMAMGSDFSSTVMPFILRGVSLLGASSNNCTPEVRKQIWNLLGADWRPTGFSKIHTGTTDLDGLDEVFKKILSRDHFGRTLVNVR
jgi:NADPH2:quinone reductase